MPNQAQATETERSAISIKLHAPVDPSQYSDKEDFTKACWQQVIEGYFYLKTKTTSFLLIQMFAEHRTFLLVLIHLDVVYFPPFAAYTNSFVPLYYIVF